MDTANIKDKTHCADGTLTIYAGKKIKAEIKKTTSLIQFCKKYGLDYMDFGYWRNGYRKSNREQDYIKAIQKQTNIEDLKQWINQ